MQMAELGSKIFLPKTWGGGGGFSSSRNFFCLPNHGCGIGLVQLPPKYILHITWCVQKVWYTTCPPPPPPTKMMSMCTEYLAPHEDTEYRLVLPGIVFWLDKSRILS